jgi:hypothetical protein
MDVSTKKGLTSLLYCAAIATLTVSCTGQKPDTEMVSVPVSAPVDSVKLVRNYLIIGDSVGNLKIGSPVTNVYDLFRKDRLRKQTYQEEGTPYDALEVYHDTLSKPSLVLALNCTGTPCNVRKITIQDSSYHTASGLRIGSAFGQLKKEMKTGFTGWGEIGFVAVSAEMPLTFVFDISTIGKDGTAKLTAATLPDSTRVKSMFMFNPAPQTNQLPDKGAEQ